MTLTMESTSAERIVEIREKQRKYFHSGATLDVKARKAALKKFEQAVLKWEKPLCDALWADLHKSYEEAYLTEISILLGEIRTHIRKIGKWTRPQRTAEAVPVVKQNRERTFGYGTDNLTVELSRAASAYPARGRDIRRLYRSAEAFTICSHSLESNRRYDL